jgi:hypothetical protein
MPPSPPNSQLPTPNPRIFGIRHHGPGSARSLRRALEALQPDVILVEGPPDAAGLLPLLTHAEMQPPVALLIYAPDDSKRAVYYPFARFSPEWQALEFGLLRGIPVRFMDLPQAHQLTPEPEEPEDAPADDDGEAQALATPAEGAPETDDPETIIRRDPLRWLAEAAGYSDSERWWEHMVEHRRDSADLFDAILEAMTALRQHVPPPDDPREAEREVRREAWMRQTIRAAQGEGFGRIAVVCGAWHAPVLAQMPPAKEDTERLKGLPKVKVQATWVPWTYGRLTAASGYGAGIESPGWYQHLWTHPDGAAVRWMTRVARLLREEDLDASSAHIIEAVRLAETLAALRDRPLPGLPELNEATRTVLLSGNDMPMRLIHEKLIVGETLGRVPDETPMVPLQQDLTREQRRLRLPPEAMERTLDLDLRKENDRDRSHLLHRLSLLNVPWGQERSDARGRGGTGKSGTFHELWRLQWQPEFAIALIEAGVWGHTILDAAAAFVRDGAEKAPDLPTLTRLVDQALLAELPDAVRCLMDRLQAEAAVASDVAHLMEALPPLANVLRYGSVRRVDAEVVRHVVDGLVARIAIGLPPACASLNDEAARAMMPRLAAVHGVIALLQDEGHQAAWRGVLRQMSDQPSLHGLLAGYCCRLLLDAAVFDAEETARRMSLALSPANEPAQAAAWVEGLLQGSGLVLLHDEPLWQVLDGWVSEISGDAYTQVLPLLRRTFSRFSAPERRAMGERAREGRAYAPSGRPRGVFPEADFDETRAEAVLPLVARLLGVES